MRPPEKNPHRLVVSINKSLSLMKASAAIYGFYNVWSTILSTPTSIYLLLTTTNKVQYILLCLYHIWLAHLFSAHLASTHLPQMSASVALCFPASQTSSETLEPLSPHADIVSEKSSTGGGQESVHKYLSFPPFGGIILRCILWSPLHDSQSNSALVVHQGN